MFIPLFFLFLLCRPFEIDPNNNRVSMDLVAANEEYASVRLLHMIEEDHKPSTEIPLFSYVSSQTVVSSLPISTTMFLYSFLSGRDLVYTYPDVIDNTSISKNMKPDLGDYILDALLNEEQFQNEIRYLELKPNETVSFSYSCQLSDLHLSLQHILVTVKKETMESVYSICIQDTYDFDDIRNNTSDGMLSDALNNMGYFLQKWKWITPYKIELNFKWKI